MSKVRIFSVFCLFMAACVGVVLADTFIRSVEVNDGNGIRRAVLFANDDANKSGLEIVDPRGNLRFSVHANNNNDVFVTVHDANNKPRIEFGIATDGKAYFVMRKGDGTAVHTLVAPN